MENQARRLYSEIIKSLVSHLEIKDPFLKKHSERVAFYSLNFSRYLKLSKAECDQIYFAALFHDYGKIFLPTPVFAMEDSLKNQEKKIWRQHSVFSQKALENLGFLKAALSAIRQHHERIDGKGFPDGLKNNEITRPAKIIGMVNLFDHYYYGNSNVPIERPEMVIRTLNTLGGSYFDSTLLFHFIKYIAAQLKIKLNTKPAENKTIKSKSKVKPKKIGTDKLKIVKQAVMKVIQGFKEGNIDLPVLPKVIQDVEQLMSNDSSTVDDLAKLIEKDAVVSVRLISVANSPVYRGNEKIITVRQAIPRLGFRETQNLISAIASRSVYHTNREDLRHLMERLWEHAYGVAQYSSLLAKHLKLKNTNLFFLFGLVHDIGKVLLIRAVTDIIDEKNNIVLEDLMPGVQEAHCQFGSALLQRWGFDDKYLEVVKHHDDNEFSSNASVDVLVVHLANLMAKKAFEEDQKDGLNLIESPSAMILNLSEKDLEGMLNEGREIMTYSGYLA